jgi:DNA-binding NarL/FixJ family response regulator
MLRGTHGDLPRGIYLVVRSSIMRRMPLERRITELTHDFARQVLDALRNASLNEIVANRALGALRQASLQEIIAMTAPGVEPTKANNKGMSMVDGWAKRYKLSPAQAWIMQAVVDGKTRDQIAAERGTSLVTTKSHIHQLLKKTGDESLLAAVARLYRERG